MSGIKRKLTLVADRRIINRIKRRKEEAEKAYELYLKELMNKRPYQPKFFTDKHGARQQNPKWSNSNA